ncbi:hypothetical protein [Flagellimonas lutimaris]|nr:hypothetical protein [Allomuricauda lutimaris]
MKTPIFILSMFVIGMVTNSCNFKKEDFKQGKSVSQEELFLGQKPPGLIPELFALGIVSTNHLEVLAAISPNLDEFYFARQIKGEVSKNLGIRFENGSWNTFMEEPNTGEMFISTDNKTMFLGNKYRERTPTGWSGEKSLESPYDQIPIMRLTSSVLGTYVFDERDSIGTLRMSVVKNGIREEPIEMGNVFNSGTYIAHPFIATDESYIIWDCEKEDGYGSSDLYISFRTKDGSWGAAINMGEDINSDMEDSYASVTSDGKYLIFHRVKLGDTFDESYADIFWVDAQIIETLRPKQ